MFSNWATRWMLLPQSIRDEEQVFGMNGTLSSGHDESEGSGGHTWKYSS